ncbi:MAG: flagellar export protein FliJ [Planctomycetota bacterium]
MKRFKFSLDKVLKVRVRRELAARRRLAADLAELARVRRRLEELRSAKGHAEREAASLSPVAGMARAYLDTLAYRRNLLDLDLSRTSAGVEASKERWLVCNRDKKALDRLREMRLRDYMIEVSRREQLELEELSLLGRISRKRAR